MIHDRSNLILDIVKAMLIALIFYLIFHMALDLSSDAEACEDEHGCDYYACKAEHSWSIWDETNWLQKEENCILRRNE